MAGALAISASGWASLAPAMAQEVVQALPPRESAQLSAAMRTLASRPNDLNALLSAGNASLALHDAGAAAGFFARAARVAPTDSRVLIGLARVALEERRPVEALQAFAQAEKAGVRPLDIAADRALAYDLVGDNVSAQSLYRSVLAVGDSAEVRRRLALSYAISGNRSEFERALYPLLRDEDRAAFRTRAFGLAILGHPDDAVEIADAMMPTDLALRMAPYLRYMPRLTKAQQAAAGNLGAFPAATEIGRDSVDIAGYASAGARIAANANSSLTPSGEALGSRSQSATTTTSAVRRRPTPSPAAAPAPAVRVAQAELPPVRASTSPAPAPAQTPAPRPTPAPAPAPPPSGPVIVATSQSPQPAPEPVDPRPSIAEVFADIGPARATSVAPAPGAVDVAKLEAARVAAEAKAAKEAEAKAKAAKDAEAKAAAKAKAEKAAKAAEPARYWVQVGVGRNTSAFSFDWKRIAKQAGNVLDGKGPWAVKYGATNRMLAGPFPSEASARTAVKQLKDKDIDALPFHSDEGEKVTKVS